MNAKEYKEFSNNAKEGIPATYTNNQLRGWHISCDDTDVFLCAQCAAQITTRGHLLSATLDSAPIPIWKNESYQDLGPCISCKKTFPTTGKNRNVEIDIEETPLSKPKTPNPPT